MHMLFILVPRLMYRIPFHSLHIQYVYNFLFSTKLCVHVREFSYPAL